ncbi:MAG: hypothetical protein ACLUI3_17850 [Christensenellales bacterium]
MDTTGTLINLLVGFFVGLSSSRRSLFPNSMARSGEDVSVPCMRQWLALASGGADRAGLCLSKNVPS